MNSYERNIAKIDKEQVVLEVWGSGADRNRISNAEFLAKMKPGTILFPTVWFLRDCDWLNAETMTTIARDGIVVEKLDTEYDSNASWRFGEWHGGDVDVIVFEDVNNQRIPHASAKYSLATKFWRIVA